jgi:outer membrane protein TolC
MSCFFLPPASGPRPAHSSSQFAGAALLALLALAALLPGRAAAQGVSLAEAERIALERDAMLRQMAAEAEAMRQRAVMEGQLMDPKLRVGASNVPTDSFSLTAEEMTMLELGVSQEFAPGDSRHLARKRMEQSAAAMEAVALDRRRLVRREVRKVWTQLAYINGARDLLDTQTEWVEQMRRSARTRYASGEGKQLDVLQAGLDAAMLREQRLDLDRDEAMLRSQLSFWLGAESAARAQPTGLPARAPVEPLATLEQRLLAHPAQVDYERRIDAADTAVAMAREQRKPGWMLDLTYGFRDGTDMTGASRSDMVSAMVTVDLPLFRGNRQDREINATRAEARGLHEVHQDHLREMQAMLAEAWSVATRTAELEQFYEQELLPLADQSIEAALLAWRGNRAMIDEVVMARRAALETRTKHLRLAADRAQAQYQIDYLAGEE